MDYHWADISTFEQERYLLCTKSVIDPGATVFKDDKGNWGFTAFGRTFLSSSRYVTKYRAMQNCEKLIRSELKSLLDELTPTENVSIDDEENPYLSTIEKLKSMFHM